MIEDVLLLNVDEVLDEEEYTNFYNCLKNKDCLISMFNFFKNRKIPDRLGMLNTKIKKDIQVQFRSSIFKYIYENMNSLDGKFIPTKILLNNLIDYEKSNNYREMTTPQLISKIFFKISENLTSTQSQKSYNRARGYDFTNLKKYLKEYDKETFEIYNNADVSYLSD